MLKIGYGVDWKANRQWMLHQVCERAKNGIGGNIIVVPDQFSHEMERQLCMVGGDSISRYAEVLSFSRLADRIFATCGGVADVAMDSGGRLIAMANAIEQVRSRLKQYGNCSDKPEFLLQLLETLDECKAFRLTPHVLHTAANGAEGALAQKLEELALLAESYDAVCANGGQDAGSRLMKLSDCLTDCDYAKGRTFYFEGFSDFNGLELEIIGQLMEVSEGTIVLLCDDLTQGQSVFECSRETAKELSKLANRLQLSLRSYPIQAEQSENDLQQLRAELFGGVLHPKEACDGSVVLYQALSAYEEAELAAGQILRYVQEGGRYRDVQIACGDFAAYRPILQSVFARHQIPAYFSGNEDILCKPIIRTILYALDAAINGMEQESVFAYLKSGLPPLDRDRCDRLENYAITWKINGTAWQKPWTMHPTEYKKEIKPHEQAILDQLNVDRELAIMPLVHLKQKLNAAQNSAQQVLALYDFLEEIQYRNRLDAIAAQMANDGKLQQAQEYVQLHRIVIDAMEQFYTVLGNTVRSCDGFYRLFRALLSQYQVGTIPATIDCVSVGGYMQMRQSKCEVLLLLGACDGTFPTASEQSGLLSETDRKFLRGLGLQVAAGIPEKLNRELLGIFNVLSAPRKLLWVSSIAEKEAYLFQRMLKLFPKAAPKNADSELLTRSKTAAMEYLTQLRDDPNAEQLRMQLSEALSSDEEMLRQIYERADYQSGQLSQNAVNKLYDQTIYLSASRFDRLADCAFAYFLQYGLKAKERKEVSFDAPIYGRFVHDVLEKTAKAVHDEGGFHRVGLDHVLELAQQSAEDFTRNQLPDLDEQPERFVYLYQRNLQEIRDTVKDLYDEMQLSDFEPEYFEMKFGEDGTLPSVQIVGTRASAKVEGYVDRVDLFRNGKATYVRVVDYKTGAKDFDYTDILNGLGLQMLIYLFALEDQSAAALGEHFQPTGVLYFPARQEMLSEKQRLTAEEAEQKHRRKRKGLLLDDDVVLWAMEHNEKPVYLPYKTTKDGKRSGELANRDQLKMLKEFVYRSMESMVDSIASGNVTPHPYIRKGNHEACRYCAFKTVCHVATGCVEMKNRKAVKAEEFWKTVEESNNG